MLNASGAPLGGASTQSKNSSASSRALMTLRVDDLIWTAAPLKSTEKAEISSSVDE